MISVSDFEGIKGRKRLYQKLKEVYINTSVYTPSITLLYEEKMIIKFKSIEKLWLFNSLFAEIPQAPGCLWKLTNIWVLVLVCVYMNFSGS